MHAKTAPQQPATLDLFERWGDTNGGQREVSHRDPYQNLCWRIAAEAVSRTGSSGTLLCPPGPCTAGGGAAAAQSLGGRQAGPSGDRRAVAIDLVRHPDRAGRCSRSAGAPGRAASRWIGRPWTVPTGPTYRPARLAPDIFDAHLPGRPTPARMPTDLRPHHPPARLPIPLPC